MALKATYDTQDDIPEAMRDLYVEKDEKGKKFFALDVDGIEHHPGAKALKNALDRVKEEKRGVTEKLTAAEARLDGLPEDFNADEYQRLKDGAKDGETIDARLTAQRTQLETKFGVDIKKKDDRLAVVEGALKKKIVDDGLTQALIDAGIDTAHLKTIKGYLAPRVKVTEEDGEFAATVDTDINPHMPLSEFAKAYAADEGKRYVTEAKGTGAPGSDGRKGEVNPWAKDSHNVTQQGQVISTDRNKARRMMKAAGKSDAEILQVAGAA